jgi:hypothetical protein
MTLPRPFAAAVARPLARSTLLATTLLAAACSDASGPDGRRATVEVVGLPDTLWSNTRDTVSAVVRDRAGTVLQADTIPWRSSDTTTFVVDSAGVVRGRQGGDAWLVVTARGMVDSARVRVDHRPVSTPVPFVHHALGPSGTCGVPASGAAWCGPAIGGPYTEVPGGLAFRHVEVGQRSRCGLATDDRIHCWGLNSNWALGAGTSLPQTFNATTPVRAAGGRRFTQVSVGPHMTACGIGLADSLARCWGHNDFGQTGRAPTGNEPEPMPVPGVPRVVDLAIGVGEGCAVTVDRALWCWGGGGFPDEIVPRETSPAGAYVQVEVSQWGPCALRPDGVAECGG